MLNWEFVVPKAEVGEHTCRRVLEVEISRARVLGGSGSPRALVVLFYLTGEIQLSMSLMYYDNIPLCFTISLFLIYGTKRSDSPRALISNTEQLPWGEETYHSGEKTDPFVSGDCGD